MLLMMLWLSSEAKMLLFISLVKLCTVLYNQIRLPILGFLLIIHVWAQDFTSFLQFYFSQACEILKDPKKRF